MDALINIQAVAAEAFATLDTGRQIEPFSSRLSSFNLDDAYRVTAAVRKMRVTRGELPVGRKIGFTNPTVWTLHRCGDMFTTARCTTCPRSAIRSRSWISLSRE
jgi:2-oxo-3-hexenedioate decarboxylase